MNALDVVLTGHEPVFIDAKSAVGIVGTDVRELVEHDRGAVAVLEVLIAQHAISG
jgi:hypothetical protein